MYSKRVLRSSAAMLLAVFLVLITPVFNILPDGYDQVQASSVEIKITPEAVNQQLDALDQYNSRLRQTRNYDESMNILNEMESISRNLYDLDQSNVLGCEAMLDIIAIKKNEVREMIEFEKALQDKLREYLDAEEFIDPTPHVDIRSSGALLSVSGTQINSVEIFYNILVQDYRYDSLKDIIPEVTDDDDLSEMLEELKDWEGTDEDLYKHVYEYTHDMRESLEQYESGIGGNQVINRIDSSCNTMYLNSKLSDLKLKDSSAAYTASIVVIGSDMTVYYKDGDKKYPGNMTVSDLYRNGGKAYATIVIRVVPESGCSFGKYPVCYIGGRKCLSYGTKKDYAWDTNASKYPDTVRYYAFDAFDFVNKYDISKTAVTLSSKTYTGKAIKQVPTVKAGKTALKADTHFTYKITNNKSIGKAKVVITGKGSAIGTKTAYFDIVPKGTSLSRLTAASKGFTAKWKAQKTQTTGYQIQYSLKSNFSGAKTVTIPKNSTLSKKVTKLKARKKYYVRVRTYKKVNGKSFYSSWSAKKTITTKK